MASSGDVGILCYTLATGAGQTATFELTRTNGNVGFSIYDVVDDRNEYSFTTKARTYKFIVFQVLREVGPTPFALRVAVQ